MGTINYQTLQEESNQTLKEEIKKIISKVARIDETLINDTTSLRNELLVDSVMAIQIVSIIEERFRIEVEEVEIFNITNLKEIVELVLEAMEKGKD